MKSVFRIITALIVVILTNLFLFWPLSFVPVQFKVIINIISSICVFGIGWIVWRKTKNIPEESISNIFLGAIIFGVIGLLTGVTGSLILWPDSNLAPILGIFLTGPLCFILGGIGGFIYWFCNKSKEQNPVLGSISKFMIWILGFSVVVCVAVIIISDKHVSQKESKYSSKINNPSDLSKRDKSLTDISARSLSDDELLLLEKFADLKYLDLRSSNKLTDKGLYHLSELNFPKLEQLMLGNCNNITDDGMQYVANISTLKYLSLMGCSQITDGGIEKLASSVNLETLDLRGCNGITDQGLLLLVNMPNIKEIMLGGCKNITDSGIKELRNVLTNAKIEKDEEEWAMPH